MGTPSSPHAGALRGKAIILWSARVDDGADGVAMTGADELVLIDGPEVGGLHGRVGLHRGRIAVGDDGAVVEDADVVADVHDEAHVVLHQQHGDAPAGQVDEDAPELDRLLLVEPRAGLVHQQHRRARGQGPAQLDEAGQTGGQQVGGLVGDVRQPDMGQDHVRFDARAGAGGTSTSRLRRHLHVLPSRQGPEELEALEGAGDAESGPVMRRQAGDVLTAEAHPPVRGGLQAGDDVEERGLPGPVGADEAVDGAGVDLQIDVLQGLEPAEAHRDLFDQELRQPTAPPRPRSR